MVKKFKLIILLLFINTYVIGQGCDDPYPLGGMGTWSECWEAPATFSDDCFDAYPESENCHPQCGGMFAEIEVNSTGVAVLTFTSDMNYSFYDVPNAPELWVLFYVMVADDCDNPIFFTSSCGGVTLGEDLLISSTGEGGSMGVDDDYTMDLQLTPFETYYVVIGNIGGTANVQAGIEGCLTLDYFSPGILELIPIVLDNFTIEVDKYPITLIKATDFLGREVKYVRPNIYYLYHYSNGKIKKQRIVQ